MKTSCKKIADRLTEKIYPPNSVILKEGSPGDIMFFIKEGMVEVKGRSLTWG